MDLKNPLSAVFGGKSLHGASCCGVRNADASLDALLDDVTLVLGDPALAGEDTTDGAGGWTSASVTLTNAIACCKRCCWVAARRARGGVGGVLIGFGGGCSTFSCGCGGVCSTSGASCSKWSWPGGIAAAAGAAAAAAAAACCSLACLSNSSFRAMISNV